MIVSHIKRVFPEYAENHLSYHFHEKQKHGIEEDLIPDGTELLLIPDASSSEAEIHTRLKEKGITTLVIDHHETDIISEDAIIVNNQTSTLFENKDLSGSAMVYLFILEMNKKMGLTFDYNYEDMCAWGIVADSINISSRGTKWLVHNGLQNVRNDLLKAMLEKNAKGLDVAPHTLSFKVNPPLNAMIRIGNKSSLENLFKALLNHKEVTINNRLRRADKTEQWAEKMARECSNAQSRQSRLRDEALSQLIEQAEKQKDNPFLILKVERDFIMNLTGLVAIRLVSQYRKPVLVLKKNHKGNYVGSMRGYDPFMMNTKDFLNTIKGVSSTGHQSAAGCELVDDVETISQRILEALGEHKGDNPILVDLSMPSNMVNTEFIESMEVYRSLWGKGIEEPLYAIKDVEVHTNDIELIGKEKNMIKFVVNGVTYLRFSGNEELLELTQDDKSYRIKLNISGKTGINKYRDTVTPQVIIEDFEIIGKEESSSILGGFSF